MSFFWIYELSLWESSEVTKSTWLFCPPISFESTSSPVSFISHYLFIISQQLCQLLIYVYRVIIPSFPQYQTFLFQLQILLTLTWDLMFFHYHLTQLHICDNSILANIQSNQSVSSLWITTSNNPSILVFSWHHWTKHSLPH